MSITQWAILEFETGRHTAIQNSLARVGIVSLMPMITESRIRPDKKVIEVQRPALHNCLFMPADEQKVRLALDSVRYAESVWRASSGDLRAIPDGEVQMFVDQLERREKKPKSHRKAINLAALAEQDAFDLFHRLFGLSEAIKRVGRDMSGARAA